MKKITLLMLLIITSASFAQLRKVIIEKPELIGKAQQFGAPLEAECTKRGNVYTISFRDAKYKTMNEYREFSFEDIDNTFNDLYAAIEDGFKTMPKESIMLELPNHYIWLDFNTSFGFPVLSLSSTLQKDKDSPIYFSNPMAKKQVDKLFGKKK